jgi:hypothetical protein
MKRIVFLAAVILTFAVVAVAQAKSASKAQMDRVNSKYDEIAQAFTLGAAYDGESGNLYFGMTTKNADKAIGYVTPAADVMNLFIISTRGPTKVLSFSGITYEADGKQKNVAAANQSQLDKLTEKLVAENGKVSSLAGYLNDKGALVFEFISGDKKITGTIAK